MLRQEAGEVVQPAHFGLRLEDHRLSDERAGEVLRVVGRGIEEVRCAQLLQDPGGDLPLTADEVRGIHPGECGGDGEFDRERVARAAVRTTGSSSQARTSMRPGSVMCQ